MKQHRKFMTALVAALLVSATGGAQTSSTTKKPVHGKHRPVRRVERKRVAHVPIESATERQMHELRDVVSGQQVQIDNLKSQLTARDQQVSQEQQSVADAQAQIASSAATTAQAAQQGSQNAQDVQQLKVSVGDLATQNNTLQQTIVADQQHVEQAINSPTTIHYKGVTIQPIGFFAFEGVWRQRSVNSDINTPFNTIPLPGANEGHISELNFSGRQSRIGALFTGDAGSYRLAGYLETDFLSSGTTSNSNESNSYTLRFRQFWGQGENSHGTRITGGQMWSLVTEDARGTDNRTEIQPNTIDPQYMVGYNWARQPAIRLQQRFGDPKTGTFTLALSAEQAQITNFTATSSVAAAVPTNFFFSGAGQNGGLYNAFNGTYANNVAPDAIVKGAIDFPHTHFEFGGIARFMRDFYYPILGTTTTTAGVSTYTLSPNQVSNTATAGGIFGALRFQVRKYGEVGVQGMGGPGVGRYAAAQLADATIKPNGTLEPIKNYHGLFSLVTHEGKKLDIYTYYGGEYDQRTVYTIPTGAFAGDTIGYGARNLNDAGCYALPANPASSTGGSPANPANCASPTRYIQEGMLGFTYRLVDSPRYGRLQYQATYQFMQRNLWSGTTATATAAAHEPVPTPTGPRAQDNMVHVSMRYYIP
ncbi:MAG: hypothetical protein ACRYFU_12590 [Janthinobacterium lividum]